MKQYASIFNDVLGPVMSGPSSSHTAASVRIGNLMRQMLSGKLTKFTIDLDRPGAIAPTLHSQWVDVGLSAGLLGMFPEGERLSEALKLMKTSGLEMVYNVADFFYPHPNTYKMHLENEMGESISAVALSTGGGMIEFIEIEGYPISMSGGFHEVFLFAECLSRDWMDRLNEKVEAVLTMPHQTEIQTREGEAFLEIRTAQMIPETVLTEIRNLESVKRVLRLKPVMPVSSQLIPEVPFGNTEELLQAAEKNHMEAWELAVWYESVRGGISKEETFDKMLRLVQVMKKSLAAGLAGTHYENRILGWQSRYMDYPERKKRLIPDDITNEIIRCVTALMEVKSAMGVFVAAPTAGACGCLPGTVLAIADKLKLSDVEIAKAMFSAGIPGIFIAERSTFGSEQAGCQAEAGSASGMTAAELAQLMGGTVREVCDAASMALQNVFGLTCDPVAMLVEVPCLGKNIMAGVNGLTSANMALAGFNAVIPLDETIEAFDEVGRMLPSELRCTGCAGITMTPAAKEIEKRMKA